MMPIRTSIAISIALAALSMVAAVPVAGQSGQKQAGLEIITERCVKCHGAKTRLGGLDLRTLDGMSKGGASGSALTFGAPNKSLLYKRIFDRSMPPAGQPKLTASEIAAVRDWII